MTNGAAMTELPTTIPGPSDDSTPPWRSKRSRPSRLSRVEAGWMASFLAAVLTGIVIDTLVLGSILATVIHSELIGEGNYAWT
jgi:hypothetical protein